MKGSEYWRLSPELHIHLEVVGSQHTEVEATEASLPPSPVLPSPSPGNCRFPCNGSLVQLNKCFSAEARGQQFKIAGRPISKFETFQKLSF